MSKGPLTSPTMAAATMDMRVRAREGNKAHQILIDAQNHREGILWGTSDAGLVEAANAALQRLEDPLEHRFVSAHCLGNSGVLLEMNNESAVGWLNAPATWASFLSHFAPNVSDKEWVFPLMVNSFPYTSSQTRRWRSTRWKRITVCQTAPYSVPAGSSRRIGECATRHAVYIQLAFHLKY